MSILLSPISAHAANPFNLIKNKIFRADPPTGAVPTADNEIRSKESELKVWGRGIGMSFDGLLWSIAKLLIDEMSDAMINWINKGYKGGPSFVTDPRQFFNDITNSVGGVIIQDIGAGALCSPLRLQITGSLQNKITGLQTRPSDPLRNRCTFTTAIGNLNNFLSGDFTQGGWNGWFHLTQNPQNNPYGAYIQTETELLARIGNSKDLARLEIDWAGGFLSPRQFPNDCAVIGTTPQEIARNTAAKICLEWKPVKTPGKTVEKTLEDALGTEIKQLEIADEVDEIIGAILGRLITDIAGKGVFKNAPGYATGPGNPNSGNPVGGSCSPDKSDVVVDDTVTWSATAIGTNLTFQWSGTDGLTGTNPTASITYTTAGVKSASVVVTDTVIDPNTNLPTTKTATLLCQPDVKVSNFAPLVVSCTPGATKSSPLPGPITWTATITGGSGRFVTLPKGNSHPADTPFLWSGDENRDLLNNPAWGFNVVTQTGSGKTLKTTVTNTRRYYLPGDKNANITVVDADTTVAPVTQQNCDASVFFY